MKLTNINNIARPIYNAVLDTLHKPDPNIYRCTQLINPPRIRTQLIKHWDDLESDVSEYLWAIGGTAIHEVLSKHAPKDWLIEHSMEIEECGETIRGTCDAYDPDAKILYDYKFTSVWKYIYKDLDDWEAQLNIYRYMLNKLEGLEVDYIYVQAFLRDWTASKSGEESYPNSQMQTIGINVWDLEETREYIHSRITVHRKQLPCTASERWQKDNQYAIMKKGRKKSLKNCSTYEMAQALMPEYGGQWIETRKFGPKRCEQYCPVRKVCTDKGMI